MGSRRKDRKAANALKRFTRKATKRKHKLDKRAENNVVKLARQDRKKSKSTSKYDYKSESVRNGIDPNAAAAGVAKAAIGAGAGIGAAILGGRALSGRNRNDEGVEGAAQGADPDTTAEPTFIQKLKAFFGIV